MKNTKNRALEPASFGEEIIVNQSQSQSTGFARDFGSIVAGTKPSGRTLDLYKYIYI